MLTTAILERFGNEAPAAPLFLPDLTLWYSWHHKRGTLPEPWRDHTLSAIAASLGVPAWMAARPYRVDWGETEIQVTREGKVRTVRYVAQAGTLTERWEKGPDGDWWEIEYPVKTPDDLPLALAILEDRTYVLNRTTYNSLAAEVGEGGVVAIELPRRPFSQVFLEWLGWSDGMMLLFESEVEIERIIQVLEAKLQVLVSEALVLPGQLFLSPDNLDAQFISPAYFDRYLAGSYRRTAGQVHSHAKWLMAGTGGYIRRLLAPLADAGVDAVQGISGPPQSDASLAEARRIAGPDLTLWGGIPQDALLAAYSEEAFEAVVAEAAQHATEDGRVLIGVADVVPVDADIDRLQRIPGLIARTIQ